MLRINECGKYHLKVLSDSVKDSFDLGRVKFNASNHLMKLTLDGFA
jgi:hypothetical protein